MLDALRQRLADAKTRRREHGKIRATLARAEEEARAARQRLSALQALLDKEQADVDALDRLSLTGMFHTILGDKDERRKQEREELVAAKLKFDECREALKTIEADVAELRSRLAALGDPEAEYQATLAEKQEALARSGDVTSQRLVSLAEETADLQADDKELREARQTGRDALRYLNQCLATLASAGNWGVADMVAGGLITTAIKHGRIDQARSEAHRAQDALRRFGRELADVNQRCEAAIEIGGFATFADYFFDGLIADYYVQTKIRRAETSVRQTRDAVQATCRRLKQDRDGVSARLAAIEAERRRLVEEA